MREMLFIAARTVYCPITLIFLKVPTTTAPIITAKAFLLCSGCLPVHHGGLIILSRPLWLLILRLRKQAMDGAQRKEAQQIWLNIILPTRQIPSAENKPSCSREIIIPVSYTHLRAHETRHDLV